MKSNATTCMTPPFDLNPVIKMWCLVIGFRVFSSSFPKYVKLVELAMVQIVSSMEDERCFFTLAFMKASFKIGSLPTYHLLCACLHNNFIFFKASHMETIFSNGKEFTIDTVMMLGNMPSIFYRLVFTKANMYCCKIEWLFYEPKNFLSTVLAFFALFSECNAMGLLFCLL
jgi:hypothetical protein